MKFTKVLAVSVLTAAFFTFAVRGAVAQHDEHHPEQQATQGQSTPGMMGQGQGMMGSGMMGMMGMMDQMNHMMGQMMTHHQQMADLMTKLMDSMKAIENEKDPAALKQKLAEHRALLEQMRTQMMQQGGMMHQMMGTGSQPPASK